MPANMTRNGRWKTRFGSFIAGLGAMASIWPSRSVAFDGLHRSAEEALEADGARMGLDMFRVIEREQTQFGHGQSSIIGGSVRAKISAN